MQVWGTRPKSIYFKFTQTPQDRFLLGSSLFQSKEKLIHLKHLSDFQFKSYYMIFSIIS